MDETSKEWTRLVKKFVNTPKLVLSVIGDSDSFVPRAWPKSVFQTALIETHKSSGGDTWILYGNRNVGVSKIVRDAADVFKIMEKTLRNDKIVLIGPSPDSTSNNEKNKRKKSKDSDVLNLTSVQQLEEFIQSESSMTEKHIEGFAMHIPIVIILVEGGLDDIKHVAEAVHKNVPVIVIKGSGKAADIILDYFNDESNLRSQAALLFGLKFDDIHFKDLQKSLGNLKERRWMVSHFDTEHDDPMILPKLVGEAVVRGWALEEVHVDEASEENPLYPGGPARYSPDQADQAEKVARPVISLSIEANGNKNNTIKELLESFRTEGYVVDSKFTSPPSLPLYFYVGYQVLQEHNLLIECGRMLLLEALKFNRTDYVKVLMDHGVNVRKKDIQALYISTIRCSKHSNSKDIEKCDCLGMMWLMKSINREKAKKCFNEKEKAKKSIKAPKTICRELLNYKKTEENKEEKKRKKKEKKKKKKEQKSQKVNPGISSKEKVSDEEDDQPAELEDILLWSLYANRPEIAETLWLRGEHQLMTGLVCYETLRKLSEEASDVKEQNFSKTLLDHAQIFYKRTLELLDSMYETDSKKTLELLDDPVKIWGITSNPLTFAYENFMYEFIAKPASQKHLNKTWYNDQAPHFIPCIKSICQRPCNIGQVLRSPLAKYIFNYVLFLTMLVSYSAFVSTSISTRYYTRVLARVFEYYVYFWGFGDLLEELFSCFGIFHRSGIVGKSNRSKWTIIWRYLNNFWNIVDLLSYALLITALFVRHMHPSTTFTVARRMFSLSLLIMYLRFLEAFLMVRTLGPTLIMIKEMLKDLFAFIILLAVVIVGVGFYYHANLWPDHVFFWAGRWTDWRFWKVIYYPYWQLYGETFNDFLQGNTGPCADECTANETIWSDASEERCPQEDWTVGAVSALYMLFSNLLLVNLVIAMFSSTYERVTANAENLWRFERYTVIMNYKYRVPSPINLIWNFWRIYEVITRRSSDEDRRSGDGNRSGDEDGSSDEDGSGDEERPSGDEDGSGDEDRGCCCCTEKKTKKTKKKTLKKFQRIMAHRVCDKLNLTK